MTENPNRYRVSTDFTIVKVFVCIGLFSVIFNLIRDLCNNALTSDSIIRLTFFTLVFGGIFYLFHTRKQIDYDDIKQALYVVDKTNMTELEIPVDQIDKILYSGVGIVTT